MEDDPDLYSDDEMEMDLPAQAQPGTSAPDTGQQQATTGAAAAPCAMVLEQAEQQEEAMVDVGEPADGAQGERSSKRRKQGTQRPQRE